MQNNTPFSRDPTPDLTRTILSVVNEGLLGKLKKKAQRFGQAAAAFNMNTENTDRNTDGLQRSKEKISALRGMVQKKKKRPMDDLLKSKEKELSWYSPKKSVKEEPEQVDELSKKTKDAYVAKRGAQLSSMMYGSDKNYNSLTGKKQANAVKGIKKAMGMKEEPEQVDELQTRERDRQMANTGQLGSALDLKEKASEKVYGKDGVVAHKSLRSMIKKANWKDEKNRLAVKEEQEYIERLESALENHARIKSCHNSRRNSRKRSCRWTWNGENEE